MGVRGEGMEGERKGRREGNGKRKQESERGGQRWSERNRPENRLHSHEGSLLPSLYPCLFFLWRLNWSYLPQGHGGTVL